MAQLELNLLGSPSVLLGARPVVLPSRKATALLAYLAITAQAHPRDSLAALLWPESPQPRARASLRQTLWALRQAGLDDWLELEQEQVALKPGCALDVAAFRQNAARASAHQHDPKQPCPACLDWLAAAVQAYQGDFLAGFSLADSPEFEDWQRGQAENLRQVLAGALERLATQRALARDWPAAIETARRWVGLDPLDEPAQRTLIRLYARSGQRRLAIQQYVRLKELLDSEIGVEPEPASKQLHDDIATGKALADSAAPEALALTSRSERPRYSLPMAPTSFLGREREIAVIVAKFAQPDCRLLTMTGLGGAGKTRLALKLGDILSTSFVHGVLFVPLANVPSAEHIVPGIVSALDIRFSDDRGLIQQLLDYLREKQMLLVLDNFEHLLDSSHLISELLASTFQPKFLVTSREPLHLQAEHVVELSGLPFPAREDAVDLEHFPAVELFLDRAQAVRPGFELLGDEVVLLARLCRLMNGLPLALELAAAWVRVLTLRDIVSEVERSLDILSSTKRDVPERHRSLRAAIDQSWNRLTPSERQLFHRLSVFHGSFTLIAAIEVCRADLPTLAALVDHSLLTLNPNGEYQLHELLRQYAAEKLAADRSEAEATQGRHCDYYSVYIGNRQADLYGGRQVGAVLEIEHELGNISAAWQWAVDHGRTSALDVAVEGVHRYCVMTGQQSHGEPLFRAAVEVLRGQQDEASQKVFVRIALRLADIREALGHNQLARDLVEQAMALARTVGNQREEALALSLLARTRPEDDIRGQLLQQSVALFEGVSDKWGVANSLSHLGWLTALRVGTREALPTFERGLAIQREIGDREGEAVSLHGIGISTAAGLDDFQTAQQLLNQSLAIFSKLGHTRERLGVLGNLHRVSLCQGDIAGARTLAQTGARMARELGDQRQVCKFLIMDGFAAWHADDLAVSADVLQKALELARQLAREVDAWYLVAWASVYHSFVDYDLGDLASAKQHARNAWAAPTQADDLIVRNEARLALAQVARAEGKPEAARSYLRDAFAAAAARPYWSALRWVLAHLGALLFAEGQLEQAAEVLSYLRRFPEPKGRTDRVFDRLRAGLLGETFAAAAARGAEISLDELVLHTLAEFSLSMPVKLILSNQG